MPKRPRKSSPGVIVRRRNVSRFKLGRNAGEAALEQLLAADEYGIHQPRVMVLVAHPDDEAIGAGVLLGELQDAMVAHVTDGAPRDNRAARRRGFADRDSYAEARRTEVVNALALVNIGEERVRCLGFMDGEVTLRMVELCHAVIDLFIEHAPDIVITHPYEGGHTDHDATAFAAHMASGILRREGVPAPVLIELTSYHNRRGKRVRSQFLERPNVPIRELGLTADTQLLKLRMFEQFISQRECLSAFPVTAERFRLAPRYVFTSPPHEGELDYERFCAAICGEEWRARAALALEQLRSRHRIAAPPA